MLFKLTGLLPFLFFITVSAQVTQKSIVFLGDSNTAIYGKKMHENLSTLSTNSNFYGLPGARPYYFLEGHSNLRYFSGEYINASGNLGRQHVPVGSSYQGIPPKMDELIGQHHPDVFVVALGGNQIGQSMRKDYTDKGWIKVTLSDLRASANLPANMSRDDINKELAYVKRVQNEVKALVDKMPASSQCIYISPPYGAETHLKPQFFHDAIKEIVTKNNRCNFIDGRVTKFVARSSSDPVHFSRAAANEMADTLFNKAGGIKDLIINHEVSETVEQANSIDLELQSLRECQSCGEIN